MKQLFITITMIMLSTYSYSQVTIKSSQLIGTKWTLDNNEKIVEDTTQYLQSYIQFSSYIPSINKQSKFQTPYYLSNSIPKSFDHSKVGTSTSGCYLIKYNTKLNSMTVLEIRTFDLKNRKMVLYNPYIRDAFRDGTITYRYLGSHGGGRR